MHNNEIAIIEEMQHQLRSPDSWCKLSLYSPTGNVPRKCGVAVLNVIDHDRIEFLSRFGGQFHRSAFPILWRFRTHAARRVHKRLSKLARRKLFRAWRFVPRWFVSPFMLFNDSRYTTHAELMELFDEAKRSFGWQPRVEIRLPETMPEPERELELA